MKTLYELLKDHKDTQDEIQTQESKVKDLKNKIGDIRQEVFDRFAPKHLLGLECGIIADRGYYSSKEEKNKYDSITESNIFIVNYLQGGYRREFANRKCKITDYKLITIKSTGEITWQITAVVANKDGAFGKLQVYSNIVDKTHLAD